MSLLFLSLLFAQTPEKPAVPPLTEEQIARLRELIRATNEKAAEVAGQLEAKERELARHYGEYELNERQVAALEAEIVELQRQKLAHYHRMHVELRTIVGKERFDVLKQRLRLAGFFGPVAKEPEKK